MNSLTNEQKIPLIKKFKNDTKNRLKKNRYFYSVLEKDLKTKNYNRWMYSYFKK